MIKVMDQHPFPPAGQTPEPAAPRPRKTLALGIVSAVAIAAGTLGTGVYLNKDSLVWQRILGTEQVREVPRTPADELSPLLDAVRLANAANAADLEPKLRAEFGTTQEMLIRHVGLLTPAALPAAQSPETAPEIPANGSPAPGSSATAAPAPVPSPVEVKLLAQRLAAAGVGLVEAALDAPDERSRSLAGTGFELVMQARTLLQAAGATQEQLDGLPVPNPGPASPGTSGSSVSPSALPGFVLSGCPLPAGSATPVPAPSTASEKNDENDPGLSGRSGAVLGQVADAAYRLAYAYNVAGARTAGVTRENVWARSEALVELAEGLERQFAGLGGCQPLRQPAYALPADAAVNPLDAARSGEEQLALLLRDAAATQRGEARAFLLQRAWEQGLYTRQATGKIPDFTHVSGQGTADGPSSSPVPTP